MTEEFGKSLNSLYLEAPGQVADDVKKKAIDFAWEKTYCFGRLSTAALWALDQIRILQEMYQDRMDGEPIDPVSPEFTAKELRRIYEGLHVTLAKEIKRNRELDQCLGIGGLL